MRALSVGDVVTLEGRKVRITEVGLKDKHGEFVRVVYEPGQPGWSGGKSWAHEEELER